MKPTVYVETTVISYLTAWRSPQLVMAANQEATRFWWDEHREHYDLAISEAVLNESAGGDVDAAQRRLSILADLPLLEVNEDVLSLAKLLVANLSLPPKAELDAVHIAVASVHDVGFLLTWNFRHIANAALRELIQATCATAGYGTPIICTPLELMGEDSDVS